MTAQMAPRPMRYASFISSQLVTEFLYRLSNNDVKMWVSPLIESVEEIFLEHRAFSNIPQITTQDPVSFVFVNPHWFFPLIFRQCGKEGERMRGRETLI